MKKPIEMKSAVIPLILLILSTTSCVSMQKYTMVENDRAKCEEELSICERERLTLESKVTNLEDKLSLREEQIIDLKDQVADAKAQRDTQIGQVEGLTELSKTANENIGETLAQLEKKDKYIHLLQAAKSRTDSINLALAVNLKKVLKDGIEDEDVEVRVDKTVVFINLSDKMLFESGSSNITSRANEVLEKIATIIESRPNFEVMVEGYTDSIPINTECVGDNWELSAKRATSVVKALQTQHEVDPNRLIAAGRGEFNALASNATPEGRAINRRTRIVIMPELDQFYDLLDPSKAPQE